EVIGLGWTAEQVIDAAIRVFGGASFTAIRTVRFVHPDADTVEVLGTSLVLAFGIDPAIAGMLPSLIGPASTTREQRELYDTVLSAAAAWAGVNTGDMPPAAQRLLLLHFSDAVGAWRLGAAMLRPTLRWLAVDSRSSEDERLRLLFS